MSKISRNSNTGATNLLNSSDIDRAWGECIRAAGHKLAGFNPSTHLVAPEIWSDIHGWWMEAWTATGKDISGFDPAQSLEDRLAWCHSQGIPICAGYVRFSSKMQKSDVDQARAVVQDAAKRGYYIPVEYISVDLAKTGKLNRRFGLERNTAILSLKLVAAMVAFTSSRIYRKNYKAIGYVREKAKSKNIRAFTVDGKLDTDARGWKLLLAILATHDEETLDGIGEGVRNAHIGLFLQGFLIGQAPVGYMGVDDPGGARTRRGTPRQRQAKHPRAAALVKEHFQLVAAGTSIQEGCRLWNKEIATWPEEDRRHACHSKTGRMHWRAYRRMFNRTDYIGIKTNGETYSEWDDEKDYNKQPKQKDKSKILSYPDESLRIVDDELRDKVQRRLDEEPRGRNNPRSGRASPLSSYLPSLCFCGMCGSVLHHYGANMVCPLARRDDGTCTNHGTAGREESLTYLLKALQSQVLSVPGLIDEIVARSFEVDVRDDGGLSAKIAEKERDIQNITRRMKDMLELTDGEEGMDADEKRLFREYRQQKSAMQDEVKQLKHQRDHGTEPLTREQAMYEVERFKSLLLDAGRGELDGEDGKMRALSLINMLVGGRINIFFVPLHKCRKVIPFGFFTPLVMEALRQDGGLNTNVALNLMPIEVQLRKYPKYIEKCDEIYRLYVEEGVSIPLIAKRVGLNLSNTRKSLRHWYESQGKKAPPLPVGYKARRIPAA